MIIQYTILFSLCSLTIEAAISSSTSSGSIRGSSSSAAAAVNDSVAAIDDGHRRELELLNNSSNNDDSHRLLQVATNVSSDVGDMRAHRYHISYDRFTNTNFYSLIATLLSPPILFLLYSQHHRIGHCTAGYQTNVPLWAETL